MPTEFNVWLTCNHNCHRETRNPVVRGIHIYNRSGDGTKRHQKIHNCTPECPSRQNGKLEFWRTSDEEYIRFSGRLYHSLRGDAARQSLLDNFKKAWENYHMLLGASVPPLPLDQNGMPLDLATDDQYHTDAPWARSVPRETVAPSQQNRPWAQANIPIFQSTPGGSVSASQQATSSLQFQNIFSPQPSSPSSSSTPQPAQPNHPTPPLPVGAPNIASQEKAPLVYDQSGSRISLSSPIFSLSYSSNDTNLDESASLQNFGRPLQDPRSSQGMDTQEQSLHSKEVEYLDYLKKHDFTVDSCYPYTRIRGGLLPGFDNPLPPSTQLRVIFVDNPEYSSTLKAAADVANSTHEIDSADYEAILKAMPKSIKKVRRSATPGKTVVTYNSWFNLPIEMAEKPYWDVTYMSWQDFVETLGSPPNPELALRLHEIRKAHLIIGGIDFSGPFLEEYSGSPLTLQNYFNALVKLSQDIVVWPNPQDQLNCGAKCHLYQQIELCAMSMGRSYPIRAIPKEDPVGIARKIVEGKLKAVLKREYSACGAHVVTPHTQHAVERTSGQVRFEKRTWAAPGHHFSRPIWFIQPYISPLARLGELRATVLGGHLMHIINTTPTERNHELSLGQVQLVTPLSQLHHPPQEGEWLARLEGGPHIRNLEYNMEFQEFVLKTVGKMVMLTELQTGRISDLRILCRLDVSVFWDRENKKYSYFVNEVTQGLNTTLFITHMPGVVVEGFFSELELMLYHVASSNALAGPPPMHPEV